MSILSATDSKANIELVKKLAYMLYPPTYKLLAELTICQAILEGALQRTPPSQLALKYNNLFGIKGSGNNGSVFMNTHEEYNGRMEEVQQTFARNDSVEASLAQHKKVLGLPRYRPLYDCTSFEEIANTVRECGYATDSHYPQELIRVYKEYL